MPPKKLNNRRPSPSKAVVELVARVRIEVAAQLGPNSTFEQRREASARLMAEALAGLTEEVGVEGEADDRVKEGG